MFVKFRELEQGEFIVVGGDCSIGCGDRSVCQFISKNKLDVPLIYASDDSAIEMTNRVFPALEKIKDQTGIKPLIAYERNNGGTFELERLAALNKANKFDIFIMPTKGDTEEDKTTTRLGWDTNTATRPAMLADLKECIDNRVLRIYDEETIKELYSFVNIQTSTAWKAQAEKGMHDDRVMALAIAWQLYLMSPSVNKKMDEMQYSAPRQMSFKSKGRRYANAF